MKLKDIKTFETGNSCFGDILRINEIDYIDIDNQSILNLINQILTTDVNKDIIIKEVLQLCLDNLQFDLIEHSQDYCEQCGNYNYYDKFKKEY